MFEMFLRAPIEQIWHLGSVYETWRVRRHYRPERHYMRGAQLPAQRPAQRKAS